jgi:DNA topoisomerase-3
MKRFAVGIARQKGIKPPPGYTKSGSICRTFLDQHAPKKAGGKTAGKTGPKPASPAQISFAEKIAQDKGIAIPDEAKSSSAAISAWIQSNQGTKRSKRRSKRAKMPPK